MVFSSVIFLFAFLPAFLAVYFAMPWRPAKNVVLLLFSLLFYAWGEPVYVWLMVASIVLNWAFALGIQAAGRRAPLTEKSTGGGALQKLILIVALAGNLAILGFFKYEGFVAHNLNRILGEAYIADLQLALPIGISFFTLQAISYVVDVYRGQAKAQKNILYLGMYIAMFPQLVAGPIVRYSQIEHAIDNRRVTLGGFAQGLRLFAIGIGKKVLLANTAAILADSMLGQSAPAIGAVGCISGVMAYTFQIYFDFSGYSDMAIGLGKMMGFDYPRNFNYPYISASVTEFWRRWHMTLGSFFRDYVYIPLGGSRVSRPRWMLNIMIVWGLTGIWHGAAWNFVLWGLYYGILLMVEKLFLLKVLSRLPRAVGHVYCIVVFFFGWLLFSVTGLGNVAQWVAGCFGAYGFTGTSTFWELQSWSYVSLIPIFVLGVTPIFPWMRKRLEVWAQGDSACAAPKEEQKNGEGGEGLGRCRRIFAAPEKGNDFVPPCEIQTPPNAKSARTRVCGVINVLVDVALIVIFLLSIASIVSGGYNPFIYFQF